jgi:hypothetical protein
MHKQRNPLDLTALDLLRLCRKYAQLGAPARRQLADALRTGEAHGNDDAVAAWLDEAAAYTADDDAAHLAAQIRAAVI